MSQPTIGRIVQYRVSADDAATINRRRKDYATSAKSISTGFVGHIGNDVAEGQVFPSMVVRVWDEPDPSINVQVFLDGNDTFWATSCKQGTDLGQWSWPEIG